MQRIDERVAPCKRDGDEIGVHLHLARQRPLHAERDGEQRVDERSNGPDDDGQEPTDPRDADVDSRPLVEKGVELVAARHDLAGDLLRDVEPASDRHRPLGEMAELVREHRGQLA